MDSLFSQIISGIIVAIILGWLGFGGTKRVVIHNEGRVRKTGKWIMIISGIAIFIGLAWAGSSNSTSWQPGHSLALLAFFVFLLGKLIAWFQRL